MGVYPFMFGTAADFDPIVAEMTARDMKEPYNWDQYAKIYFPQAEKLRGVAEEAESKGEMEKASEYYLRSSAVYRISRFPAPRSEVQREAWKLGKECALKGLRYGMVLSFSLEACPLTSRTVSDRVPSAKS